MQDLYTKNNERLMREIKEDSSKWRNIPCLWIGRLNIVIVSYLQIDLQIQHNPNQNPSRTVCRKEEADLKIDMEMQRTQKRLKNLKKKSKSQGFALPGFKTYYKGTIMKKVWYWHKDRQKINEQNSVQQQIFTYMVN